MEKIVGENLSQMRKQPHGSDRFSTNGLVKRSRMAEMDKVIFEDSPNLQHRVSFPDKLV